MSQPSPLSSSSSSSERSQPAVMRLPASPVGAPRPPVRLLLRLSARYLQRHPWQLVLAVLGVAVGVAMLVAVELATVSARRAFELSSEQVAGRTTHQVVAGPRGLDPLLAFELSEALTERPPEPLSSPVVITPVIEAHASSPRAPGLSLTVLGLQPAQAGALHPMLASEQLRRSRLRFMGSLVGQEGVLNWEGEQLQRLLEERRPAALNVEGVFLPSGGLVLTDVTAQRLNVEPGQTFPLKLGNRERLVLVLAVLSPPPGVESQALEGLLWGELGTLQTWLERDGQVDRLDLILPTEQAEVLEPWLKAHLPPDATLTRPAQRAQAMVGLTQAFETNLQAVSLLALLVGMFLIYNTMTFSVVQRRGLVGTLRCLGLTRGEICAQVLAEAFVVGLVGTLLGLQLGVFLAQGLIGLVSQTINDLYFSLSVREVSLAPLTLLKGTLLGIVATLGAASLPALEATRTSPRMALRRSSAEERMRALVPRAAGVGVVLFGVSYGLHQQHEQPLELSFVTLFAGVLGWAALTPALMWGLVSLLRPVLGLLFGLLGRMAARDLVASLSRTSIAVAALMIAVSTSIGIGLMVGSFRETVVSWLEYTLQADVYVSVPGAVNVRSEELIPAELEAHLRADPDVLRVRTHRRVKLELRDGPLEVVGATIPLEEDRRGYKLVAGEYAQVWAAFDRGEALITEPLATRWKLRVGDRFELPTVSGPRAFTVAGIYYDYATDRGLVTLDQPVVLEQWQVEGVTAMGLYARPGVDIETWVMRLRGHVPAEVNANIRSARTLRNASIEIFDRTFSILTVLQLLSTGVAFIGILSALMALQLERARELAVLRAIGLTPGQVWRVVVLQTSLMGVLAGLLAAPLGSWIAWLLVEVINRRSFGWSMPLELVPSVYGESMMAAVLAAALAGLFPAWKMSRTSPALALREE
ncbi:MAG: FtsX-like permease family protein [Myxococcota bacterium]